MGASVELIHVFSGSHELGQPLVFSPGKGRQEVLQDWLEEFAAQRNPSVTEVPVHYQAVQGLVESTLIEHSKRKDVQWIVMGATGSGHLSRKLFGSVSEAVSLKAACPIILVPKDHTYQGIQKILYACDWDSLGQREFDQIQYLANIFHASFHFLHVHAGQHSSSQIIDFQEALCHYLTEQQRAGFAFTISIIHGDSVSERLLTYLDTHPADLIILATHRRTFWQRFFSKSTTKSMVYLSKTPMMVFHLGD